MRKGGEKGQALDYIEFPMLIGHLKEYRFQLSMED
jgi:hypothetical protein